MPIDKRFEAAATMIELDKFQKFSDLFEFKAVTKTALAEEIGMNYKTFDSKLKAPRRFTIGDILDMAKVFGVDYTKIASLLTREISPKKK